MGFWEFNYTVGIFLFLADRIINFIQNEKNQKNDKETELELNRAAENLEEELSYYVYLPNLAKNIVKYINLVRNNIFLKEFILLLLFQIPAVNLLLFLSDKKKEKVVK